MREIILDTETTGLDPYSGDRLVEIGCVEMVNHVPSGRHFHKYINPERDMPAGAFAVHGLSSEFLAQYPVFAELAGAFLDFIGDARLVIHNAEFDMKFINYELAQLGFPKIAMERVTDTLAMARRKFPGSPASLDALCKRFEIDNSQRQLHGALLDSQLLAEVYIELLGGKQPGLGLGLDKAVDNLAGNAQKERQFRPKRPHSISEAERAAHSAMLAKLKNPLFDTYLKRQEN